MADPTNYLQKLVDILKAQGATATEHAQNVLQAAQEILSKPPTSTGGTVGQPQKK